MLDGLNYINDLIDEVIKSQLAPNKLVELYDIRRLDKQRKYLNAKLPTRFNGYEIRSFIFDSKYKELLIFMYTPKDYVEQIVIDLRHYPPRINGRTL